MLGLISAELVNASSATAAPTLAGVRMNAIAADVVAEHAGAKKSSDQSGWQWTWSRAGGGTVTIWPDTYGKIWRVKFVSSPGEADSIDLPCVKDFPIQGSREAYDAAIDSSICFARSGRDTLRLRDGSFFEADFQETEGSRLERALWSRPAVVSMPPLPVRCCILAARIESDKTEYRLGEPIMLRVSFINTTRRKIFFGPVPPFLMHLEVLDGDGKPLQRGSMTFASTTRTRWRPGESGTISKTGATILRKPDAIQ